MGSQCQTRLKHLSTAPNTGTLERDLDGKEKVETVTQGCSLGITPLEAAFPGPQPSLSSLRSFQWKPDPSVADSMMFAQMLQLPKSCWIPRMPSESFLSNKPVSFPGSGTWHGPVESNPSLFQLPFPKLGSHCNERIWEP